ncbi:hypothetical protein Q1695_010895 [Nippostrongylus brasiliensis]|nr:hypothetical protein Q1695_010895 [Nippostrongylus brasiliensis]
MWPATVLSSMYLVFINITICITTHACSFCLKKRRVQGGGKSISAYNSGRHSPMLKSNNDKNPTYSFSAQKVALKVNSTQVESSDRKHGAEDKGLKTKTPTRTLTSAFSPLPGEKDEGCDDYLNALGEEAQGEENTQTDSTRTGKPRKKKKKKRNKGVFIGNTMDNVPTVT